MNSLEYVKEESTSFLAAFAARFLESEKKKK